MFLPWFVAFMVTSQIYCFIMLRRNDNVHAFRSEVLRRRPDVYDKLPEYMDMVWEWWKPLGSYLEDIKNANKK